MVLAHSPAAHRPVRVGRASAVIEPRLVAVCGVLVVALLVLLALSLSLGSYALPLPEVLAAVVGAGSAEHDFIIRSLRLPRALTGALVGVAFGLSGCLFQRLTRNVLASPDIIGITAGASTGAVLLIVVAGAGAGGLAVGLGALGGGLAAAAAVYAFAWRGGVTGYRFVLVGIGVSATLTSVVHYLLTRAQINDAARAQVWLTGSLGSAGWVHVATAAAAVAVLGPVALVFAQGLRALLLGDDTARALGVRVQALRGVLVLAAVGLAAMATAAAGPLAFVALASPPLAKRLTATAGVGLVPAALVGACVVLAADLVAQHLLGGLPVGVATALVGAPYLLFLLSRADQIGADG